MKFVIAFDTFIGASFLFLINKFDNKNRNLLLVCHIICIVQSLYCAALVTVLASSVECKILDTYIYATSWITFRLWCYTYRKIMK